MLKWPADRDTQAESKITNRKEQQEMSVRASILGLDYSLEATKTGVVMLDMTALNFDAQVTALGAAQTGIQGVTLIAFDGAIYPAVDTPRETVPPASAAAQREIKWLCRLTDAIDPMGNWSFEIGGADTSLLVLNSDIMDLTAGAGLALKTAIEANTVSRLGNAVVLAEAKLVGRNI